MATKTIKSTKTALRISNTKSAEADVAHRAATIAVLVLVACAVIFAFLVSVQSIINSVRISRTSGIISGIITNSRKSAFIANPVTAIRDLMDVVSKNTGEPLLANVDMPAGISNPFGGVISVVPDRELAYLEIAMNVRPHICRKLINMWTAESAILGIKRIETRNSKSGQVQAIPCTLNDGSDDVTVALKVGFAS